MPKGSQKAATIGGLEPMVVLAECTAPQLQADERDVDYAREVVRVEDPACSAVPGLVLLPRGVSASEENPAGQGKQNFTGGRRYIHSMPLGRGEFKGSRAENETLIFV